MKLILEDSASNCLEEILYYISEIKDSVYILYVTNSKKDFNQFLKLHNYFKNYFKF